MGSTMKLIAMLCILAFVKAKEKSCSGIKINDNYYEKELLKSDMDKPYMLKTDYGTNTLYFSYSADANEQARNISFVTVSYNLNTKTAKLVNVQDGFSVAVDSKTKEIFIGGDGISKYNPATDKSELIDKVNDIWLIYSHDGTLYYITFPSQFLFTLKDGVSKRYQDLEDTKLDNFVIDNEGTMFFSNVSGFYGQQKGTKDAVKYKDYTDEDIGVRGLSIDTNGGVYICDDAGILKVNKQRHSLDDVYDVSDCYGIAFDNNNQIIYSDESNVFRLVRKNC